MFNNNLWNRRRHVPHRPWRHRRERYTREEKERAIRLLNEGTSCRETARQIRATCAPSTVLRWRRQWLRNQAIRHAMQQNFQLHAQQAQQIVQQQVGQAAQAAAANGNANAEDGQGQAAPVQPVPIIPN